MVAPSTRPRLVATTLIRPSVAPSAMAAVVLREGEAQDAQLLARGARLGLAQADMGELGIGIGDPRHGVVASP